VSGGNNFGYFCANDSAVIEANVALTFSRGMGGGQVLSFAPACGRSLSYAAKPSTASSRSKPR